MEHPFHAHKKKDVGISIAVVGLLIGTASALADTYWSVYAESLLGSASAVGYLSAAALVLMVLTTICSNTFLRRFPERKIYVWSLLIFIVCLLLYAFTPLVWVFILATFLSRVGLSMRVTSWGILVRDQSSAKNIAAMQGMRYALANVGWVIGPLIAALVANEFGIPVIFLVAAVFTFLGLGIFRSAPFRDIKHKTQDSGTVRESIQNLKIFFRQPKWRLSYLMSAGVSFWWSMVFIFVPLYMLSENMPVLWVGIFMFFNGIPLVLLEYRVGKMTSRVGVKHLLFIGYSIAGVCALAAGVLFMYPILVLVAIIFASFGLAYLESTRESYFFMLTKQKDEERFYGSFNTSLSVGSLVGRLLGATVLLFAPYQVLFVIVGIVMLFIAYKTKNILRHPRPQTV